MWGELDAIQIARLPRNCLDTMVHDYAHLKNGQRAVDGRDARNMKEAKEKGVPHRPIIRTEDGIMEAFLDGRMVQLFTILQFHHHDEVWFERLLAVEPAVAEEERVIAQKRKEKEEEKKRLREAGKKEKAGTKRKAKSAGAGGDGSKKKQKIESSGPDKKRKTNVKRKGPVEDESDSDIEFVGSSIPAESRCTSRRLNTLSSGQSNQIEREQDEEDEDEVEDEDQEMDEDEEEIDDEELPSIEQDDDSEQEDDSDIPTVKPNKSGDTLAASILRSGLVTQDDQEDDQEKSNQEDEDEDEQADQNEEEDDEEELEDY